MDELPYERWLLAHGFRESDRQRIRDTIAIMPLRPKFSVLMPVYETPERYLREAIESVIAQVYPDWELCIVDDASQEPHVRTTLEAYAAEHSAHQASLSRAERPHRARTATTRWRWRPATSLLCSITTICSRRTRCSRTLLRSTSPRMSTCSIPMKTRSMKTAAAARRTSSPTGRRIRCSLATTSRIWAFIGEPSSNEVGGFRPGFEGSQDYDLLLRVTERTNRVVHIPHVLYHWREHPARRQRPGTRSRTRMTPRPRALREALERRGEPGRVEHDENLAGLYSVRYEIAAPGNRQHHHSDARSRRRRRRLPALDLRAFDVSAMSRSCYSTTAAPIRIR